MELGLMICLFLALNARTVSSQVQGCSSAKVDLVMMLDTSGSVGKVAFKKMLTFCEQIITTADIHSGNVRVGILSFSHTVKIAFNLNKYLTKLKMIEALERITYNSGNTNTADALKDIHSKMFTNTSGDRESVPNVVIMLTDGETSNVNTERMDEEVNTIRKNDIAIYAVVSKAQSAELKSIVTPPTSVNIIHIDKCHLVDNLISRVFKATYSEPLTIVSTLYIKKGNPVILQCNVSDNQTEVHWKKKILSRKNKYSTAKLDVFNITSMNYSDEGTYICHSGNFNSTCQTNSVVLKLLEPLTIVSTLYVKKGNPVKLQCNVSDNQTEVHWKKKTLSGNNTYSIVKLDVFNISSMNYSDEGTYVCYTGNSNSTCQTVVLKLLEDKIPQTISNAEIDKKVLELKKTLEIRKNETARYRSMKTSATDDRLSSAVMGYAGVIVIVSIISLFVFFDCLSVWQYYYDT